MPSAKGGGFFHSHTGLVSADVGACGRDMRL